MHPYLQEGVAHPSQQNYCHRGKQHRQLPVVMICLQKQCFHRRKCCLTCMDELHRKHQLISIHKFKSYVTEILNHNALISNREQIMKAIEDSHKVINGELNFIKTKFLKHMEQIEGETQKYFHVIKSSFLDQNNESKIKELEEEFTDEKVNEVFQLTRLTEKNLVQSINQIKKSTQNTLKLLSAKSSSLEKQFQKNFQAISTIIKQFKITGQIKSNSFFFNQQTKASCLVIGPDKKKASRGEGTGGYPIVLVNQPFTQFNNEIKFRITEEPEKKGMWLGVCVKEIVKNFNYQSCYGLNKGTWAIDQVGLNHMSAYSWSHHDSNYNSSPKVGWQFNLGDIVSVRVDFESSKVIFKRDSDVYEQPIQLTLGQIYAFAGPTNLGDTYQIV